MSAIVWLGLAVVLLAAAALKAADRTGTTVALAAYGIPGRLAAPAWAALIAAEAALAAGIAAGVPARPTPPGSSSPRSCSSSSSRSPRATRARRAAASARAASSRARRRAGPRCWPAPAPPCRCSARARASRSSPPPPSPPRPWCSPRGRRAAPRGALELADEGPALGATSPLEDWFAGDGIRLALFTSPGCALCRGLAPAADALAGDGVAVRRFDEVEEPEAWAAGRVPGAPFAIALGPGGVVLAKGTVNDARQLASVVGRGAPARPGPGTSRRAFLPRGRGHRDRGGRRHGRRVVRPGDAEAYHFCGHIYTTDGCPHPTGLPRIDRKGLPLRARDGKRVDDLGPADRRAAASRWTRTACRSPTWRAARSRPRRARPSARRAADATRIRVQTDGAWYRCCHGRVRKLVDCCADEPARINGDRSLKGYCYDDRKVFCVMYFQSSVPC